MTILNQFREAVEIQQKKDDEAYEEQIKLPVAERVAKGITMTNLKVIFDFHEYPPNQWCPHIHSNEKFIKSAQIICQNNISKFREGASVMLSNGDTIFKMEIEEDSIENFVLSPNDFDVKECYIDASNYNRNNWEINILKSNVTKRLLLATANNLEYDYERLEKIENLFEGSLSNPNKTVSYFNALNPSQNVAVQKAFNKQNFHLIQGPPGTGKTEAIGHLAKLLIDSGKKCICNRANSYCN